jgi:hypothetical protein
VATCLAAVTSFAAGDFVASAGGIALASSGVLAGQPPSRIAVLLVGSYLAWALGMRVSLRANVHLLRSTGTSTNVFSKMLYDGAVRRSASERAHSLAASTGYVGMQLVLEMPYYVSAFGAAAATELIDATDALIFLAGTNLAAAAYEYSLGRMTHGLVVRRNQRMTEPAVVPW